MRALSPDWISSIPRNNHTATLRVVIRSQPYIYIEQDYLEGSSVLNGFALIGGVWTLINGIFAAIFGSTLLLVLFGMCFRLPPPQKKIELRKTWIRDKTTVNLRLGSLLSIGKGVVGGRKLCSFPRRTRPYCRNSQGAFTRCGRYRRR